MRNKTWKMRTVAVLLLFMIGCVGVMIGCEQKQEGQKMDPLKVTLFRVGKADAIVLEADGRAMVIDAGEEEDGEEIVEYLNQQYISQIDTLVITHYDRDHVGGADTLVENFDIGQVLVPAYQGSNTEYVDFIHALDNQGMKAKQLNETMNFSFGEAEIVVEPPTNYEMTEGAAEMDNNFSLITTVVYGNHRMLFMGDAEKQRIREWLSEGTAEKYDFLKVPHHGVYNTAMKELIAETKPEYAVICSSNKNPADVETLELLKQFNIQIFQTKDGNVTMISDGSHLELHQELED